MKKLFSFFVLILMTSIFAMNIANAQSTANYVVTPSSTGSLTDMSSGTTQLVGPAVDDGASSVTNIGFDVWFMGVRFTQFSASSNGYMRLGGTAVSTTQYTLGSTASQSLIAAYGSDLLTSTTGKVHYKVIGSAPSRSLVVEYKNMTIIYDGAGATADGTYQIRMYESTGVIELVYGSMNRNSSTGFGGGMDPQFIGIASSNVSNTWATIVSTTDVVTTTGTPTSNQPSLSSVIGSLNSGADGSRKVYTFTPPVPVAPTILNFTAVSATAMTLNWTDNSGAVEDGFVIYRSTDGINYTFATQTAANAVSSAQSGLTPSTPYFWKVYAVSEGALSTSLDGSQATNAPGIITSAISGPWNTPGTWTGGVVPAAGDFVTITGGTTVTIDLPAAVCLNLTVASGGTLEYQSTPAASLTVGIDVTVDAGGNFAAGSGTVQTHSLSLAGNLTNNGTFDFFTTASVPLTFTGVINSTFSGTGATTDLHSVVMSKSARAQIVELNLSNFTVRGLSAAATGALLLTNSGTGTIKFSGTNTFNGNIWSAAGYTIAANMGFWLNNPNFTVNAQSGTCTQSGLLRISDGTYNVGTGSGSAIAMSTGSTTIIEGGAVNSSGRLAISAAANAITYTQSGGTITVNTAGNTSTTLASFDLGTALGSTINMSGGTIICQLANTAVSGPRDYRNQAGTGVAAVTGGTLQLGNGSSGAAKSFTIGGVLPLNLVITNTSANHTATINSTLVNYNNLAQNITINAGNTLTNANLIFLITGNVINNGTMTSSGASSRLYHLGNGSAQTYSGAGTFTAPLNSFDLDNPLGLTFSTTNQVPTTRIILFSGSFTNSNKFTLGNGGATTGTVQIGNTTTPTAAGTFDLAPTFNLGTGGEVISYLRTTNAYTTGPEITGSRILTALTYDDNDPSHSLTLSGGNLSTGTLTLTNGKIITTSSLAANIEKGAIIKYNVISNKENAAITKENVVSNNENVAGNSDNSRAGIMITDGKIITPSSLADSKENIANINVNPAIFTDNVANVLTVTGTTVASVVRTNGYVSGPLERTLPANLVSGSTYVFPIGKTAYNPSELVNPTTGAGGTVVIRSEAFDGATGGSPGLNMSSLNSDIYWSSSITSGAGNFTNTSIRFTDAAGLGSADGIGQSSTQTGAYDFVGGVSVGTPANTISTNVLSSIDGYFVMGNQNLITDDVGITAATVGSAGQIISIGKGYNLNATVKNFGSASQNPGIPVYYDVNGGSAVGPIMTTTTLVQNATEVVTFSGGFAFIPVVAGANNIRIWTDLGSDQHPVANDTLAIVVNVQQKIAAFPYVETFTTPANWTILVLNAVGTDALWGTIVNVTGPDGLAGNPAPKCNFYGPGINSGRVEILRSPEMDFTGVSNPVLDFYVAYRTYQTEVDQMEVLVSVDGGVTFNPASTPYNKTTTSTPCLATLPASTTLFNPAAATNWRHETVDLSNVGNTSNVVIGFKATSGNGNNAWIDNVIVTQPNSLCTDAVTGPGLYNCNALVDLNFTNTPAPPPNNGNNGVSSVNVPKEISGSNSIPGSMPVFVSDAKYIPVNYMDATLPATAFVSQYTNVSSAGIGIAANTTATCSNVGTPIFTPSTSYDDYWFTITYDGNGPGTYATYDISIKLGSLFFSDPTALYIMKRCDRTGEWVCVNTTTNGSYPNQYLLATGLTDFSDFAIGGNDALPVELSSFVSLVNLNNVTLNWSTTTETNNSKFEIERSIVNGTWSKVGTVNGNGTTTSPHIYSITDRNVASGTYSYRLKQLDFNGNFTYYNLTNEVNIGLPTKYELSQNYPNPFNPSTKISYDIPFDGKVSLTVFDMSGKEVINLVNEVKTAGYYTVNFNASNLSSGTYFYRINAEGNGQNFVSTKKMMLLK